MKKRNLFKVMALFVAMGMMLGFTACSNDDDGDGSIVGVWTFNSLSVDVENSEYPEAAEGIQAFVPFVIAMMQGSTFEAKSDGTIIVTVEALGETSITTGTYEKSGNKYIIIMDSDDEAVIEIMPVTEIVGTINGNTLTLKGSSLDDETIAEGFTKYDVTMTYKK